MRSPSFSLDTKSNDLSPVMITGLTWPATLARIAPNRSVFTQCTYTVCITFQVETLYPLFSKPPNTFRIIYQNATKTTK